MPLGLAVGVVVDLEVADFVAADHIVVYIAAHIPPSFGHIGLYRILLHPVL